MCDFFSAICNVATGEIYHDTSNGHSKMRKTMKWPENTRTDGRLTTLELENPCNGENPPSINEIVKTMPDGGLPDGIASRIEDYYKEVWEAIHEEKLTTRIMSMEFSDVRVEVARYAKSDSVREKFVNDVEWPVRQAVARYSESDRLREKLVNDVDWKVRRLVAQYAKSDRLREKLVNDVEWCVRRSVATNAKSDELRKRVKL